MRRANVSGRKMIKKVENRDVHLRVKTLDLMSQAMAEPKGEGRDG